MKKLALLLSLLALGALGFVACGGGDDDEATVGAGGEAVTVEDDPASNYRLSDEARLEQTANEWAAAFAKADDDCRYYAGPQPACERATCQRAGGRPIKNCTPPSPEFRKSFANATVERVVIDAAGYGTAEFSNGEFVEFEGPGFEGPGWWVSDWWIEKIKTLHPDGRPILGGRG
jgi:hypothetical protein